MTPHHPDHLRVAIAQIAPVLLDRDATLEKVHARVREAADAGARLVAFPETIVPGYPTWLARTDGARFDDPLQKELHSRYLDQALELPGPELQQLLALSSEVDVAIDLGCAERGRQAGRGTLWASALWIGTDGSWSSHRKLVPTYEERLAWGPGDGHGLRVHDRDGWRVGALNCWENWMPAARMSLLAEGEEVHVSLWPGSPELTGNLSRVQAREGRTYVLAASGVLRPEDVPLDLPGRDALLAGLGDSVLHGGGSRIVGPDGRDIEAADEPVETLLVADLSASKLRGERQNFDPTGHYHRPDVFKIEVDRTRRAPVEFRED